MNTCANCRYWVRNEPEFGFDVRLLEQQPPVESKKGRCHLNPPVADQHDFAGHFPVTLEDWWCGQFQPLERAQKVDIVAAPVQTEGPKP